MPPCTVPQAARGQWETDRKPQPGTKAWKWVVLAFALLLAAIALVPIRHFGFVAWDDPKYVENNAELGPLGRERIEVRSQALVMGNDDPITMLCCALDIRLAGGKDPRPMHVTNAVLHFCNIALVFLFLFIILLTRRAWLAALFALPFAVHPMRVGSIAWIGGRQDLLMLPFGLLLPCACVRHVRTGGLRNPACARAAWRPVHLGALAAAVHHLRPGCFHTFPGTWVSLLQAAG